MPVTSSNLRLMTLSRVQQQSHVVELHLLSPLRNCPRGVYYFINIWSPVSFTNPSEAGSSYQEATMSVSSTESI